MKTGHLVLIWCGFMIWAGFGDVSEELAGLIVGVAVSAFWITFWVIEREAGTLAIGVAVAGVFAHGFGTALLVMSLENAGIVPYCDPGWIVGIYAATAVVIVTVASWITTAAKPREVMGL